jgi:hypothetical protein
MTGSAHVASRASAPMKKPPGRGRLDAAFRDRVKASIATRIVRLVILTIGHAVTITVTICAVRNTITVLIAIASIYIAVITAIAGLPSAAIQAPAVIALLPLRLFIVVAGTRALPMALSPGVRIAIPVPITRRPFISTPWGWNDFVSCRRRGVADNEIKTYLRDCLGRDNSGGTENKCRSGTENTFHDQLPLRLYAIHYIALSTRRYT